MNEADKARRRELRREGKEPIAVSYQCTQTWYPGDYPWVARCIGDMRIPHMTHVSRHGHEHTSFTDGRELPLRLLRGADGGTVLVCAVVHKNGDPCGLRWAVSNPLSAAARLREALTHVEVYETRVEARTVVMAVFGG